MRISEDRFSRDLRRINLAQRMIRHEVRTQWIILWTGFNERRVQRLFCSYEKARGLLVRPRGRMPRKITAFLRSPTLRAEASAAAGLAFAMHILPREPVRNAERELPSLERGERLCQVFELYRQLLPESRLTLDQLIHLVMALAEGTEIRIAHCTSCHAALLVDPFGSGRRQCAHCRDGSRKFSRAGAEVDSSGEDLRPLLDPPAGEPRQEQLF
jgi:hypothetical protein